MQVAMLGPLEVRTDAGSVLELGGARLRALLILLALETGQVVTTNRLVDALWGDQAPAGAGNALQALVSRLRRAVPEATVVTRPTGYQLMLAPDLVDVPRFERLAATGRAELRTDPAAAARTLRAALALWRGPALADVTEADFARAPIARLDELRLTAVQDRIDADLRLDPTESLVAELEGLVAAHPLREPLVGRLLRALHAVGRRGAALAAYEQARSRLAEQLGVRPSAELAALHVAILRADQGQPAAEGDRRSADKRQLASATGTTDPDRPAEPRGTNLRTELTSFVGRDEELALVGKLLDAHRLTTLTGPGGAGKTRLAVEAAGAHLAAMPDGVWLVELAPVSDPAEVAPTMLAALGLREQVLSRGTRLAAEPADPIGRLVSALSGKQTLLVLDNCEHLVAAAAQVAHRILGACPGVRIVATSREPLNIPGEVLWPVRSLALPPADAELDPTSILGYASVQLLVHRAGAVRPGFAVTAGNAAAVAGICRALDGMPLAIELAAARLRTMAPDQVAARLDDRFRLLNGGSRTALPRHQTLRAVVDWSWDLLDEAERALCRRFSVFSGGATLEAVERVCAGGPVAGDDILDVLTALVDKSLVVVRHGPDGTRYRMLEIIRAYGQQRLAEAGERDALRIAHGGYFLEFAEIAQDHLLDASQLPWLSRLADDHDNLHAAIRAAVAAGDAATALGLTGTLGWYWWLRGHKVEGVELTREALAAAGVASDERRAVAYTMGALLAIDGAPGSDVALNWFRASGEITDHIEQPVNPVLRLVGPLMTAFETSRSSQGPMATEAMSAAVNDPNLWLSATARLIRGHVALNFGQQHAEAEADFLAGLDIYRSLGERWGLAFTLISLATLATWRGEHHTAVAQREQALVFATELGTMEDVVWSRTQLARDLWLLGEHERAQAELAHAARDAQRMGLPEVRASVAMATGELARLDGDLTTARAQLTRAVELAADLGVPAQFRSLNSTALGYLAAAEHDLAGARTQHVRALATAVSSNDAPVIANALVGLADLAMREADPTRAATLLGASLAIRGTPDRSVVDEPRTAAAARAALGDAGYDAAYRRGQSATMSTVAELAGLGDGPTSPGGETPGPPAARTPR